MARFLPLSVAPVLCLCGALGLAAAPAASGPTNATPTKPVAPASAPAPGLNKVTGAPPPPPPPPIEEYVSRYGKILSPSDQTPYSFKLTMPFPGVGEIKVPRKDELDVRQKLEQLATLSDTEIRDQLEKWPAYAKMSLGDEGAMLTRIQQFRDHRSKTALDKAHHLGLVTLTPAEQARFEKEYWDKRLEADRQLSQQLDPIIKASDQKLDEALFREFSSPGALAQGPKPLAPAPPAPAVPPPKPVPVATH